MLDDLGSINRLVHIIVTILNIFIASIVLLFCLIYFVRSSKATKVISRDLKFYFITCLLPWGIFMQILSIFSGVYYLSYENYDLMTFKVVRFTITICTQQIRYCYLFLVIDRIAATIFYKNYANLSTSCYRLAGTILLTYGFSTVNAYVEYLRIFVDPSEYFYTLYLVLCCHVLTIILSRILYLRNRQKFESLAYQVSLTQRYQIYENLKTIKFLWPSIVIFSTIAPCGPTLVLIYKLVVKIPAPPSLFFVAYNISFLIMLCGALFTPTSQPVKVESISIIKKEGQKVIDAHGRVVPGFVPVDKYFNDLQQQWK